MATHHHQAIDRLGHGLAATAWAADGTVEAVEFATSAGTPEPRGFAVGVQWHPEETGDPRLFGALVAAADAIGSGPGPGVADPGGRRHLRRLRHPGAGTRRPGEDVRSGPFRYKS